MTRKGGSQIAFMRTVALQMQTTKIRNDNNNDHKIILYLPIQHLVLCIPIATMSLAGMHGAHVSMSSDFSSSLGLAELLQEYEKEEKCRLIEASPRIDERTPLNGHKDDRKVINPTLLITIIVVTIGSSFQFGYGTGKSDLMHVYTSGTYMEDHCSPFIPSCRSHE